MKKRLPAIDQQIDSLLAGRLGSHLQDGDTIGIWTFSKDLRMGDMPLQRWSAQNSTIVADNIKTFIESQDYDKDTDFNALQPYLNGLISHSDRLIVFIFSYGDGQIVGTPYDERISNIFKKRKGDMRKARQPFVLVFTTQQGQFAGANLGEPPGGVAIPNFPPWPQPPPPSPRTLIVAACSGTKRFASAMMFGSSGKRRACDEVGAGFLRGLGGVKFCGRCAIGE